MITIEEIIKIIKEIIDQNGQNFDSDTDLIESEILDSLGLMMLIVELEEKYLKEEIEPDELIPENFSSARAICSFLNRKNNG